MKKASPRSFTFPEGTSSKDLPTTFGSFDGREESCLDFVRQDPRTKDNPSAVTAAIDAFAHKNKWMMNVGDVKGKILDDSLTRTQPRTLLELGTYIGYSSLRMIQRMPEDAHIYTIEFSSKAAAIAREMIDHAGMSSRITVVHGYLQDKGKTKEYLESELGFKAGFIDFVFIDHAKDAYLPDLRLILESGWLHEGSVAFADNVLFPGAPDYKKFMEDQEGRLFKTKMTKTWVEYQEKIPDLVLESVYLGKGAKM